jgi:predicted ATPase
MARLKKIEIENFRVFEESTEFEFPPLCILTGANSSGKSSLFKALLLLSGSVNNSFYRLDFTSPLHNLGSFDDAVNKKNKNSPIRFKIYIENPFARTRKMDFSRGRKTRNVYLFPETNSDYQLLLELEYKEDKNHGKLSYFQILLLHENKETILLNAKIAEKEKEEHILRINLGWFKENYQQLVRQVPISSKEKNTKLFELNNNNSKFVELHIEVPNSKKNKKKINEISENHSIKNVKDLIDIFFQTPEVYINEEITKELKNIGILGPPGRELWELERFLHYTLLRENNGYNFENIDYVEAVRAKSRRIYTHDFQSTLLDELLLDYNSIDLDKSAQDFLKNWLIKFGIADDIKFEAFGGGVATQIFLEKSKEWYSLADLGYGVTQFLPLVLKIAFQIPAKKSGGLQPLKKIIILEEPETNLHPKLQSRLADMLLDATGKFEIKFIIETHSEYLIRRLQILTGEKILQPEDSIIYYFYEPGKQPADRKQVEKIKILPDGNLDNQFGSGFFDEATNMKFELLKFKSQD